MSLIVICLSKGFARSGVRLGLLGSAIAWMLTASVAQAMPPQSLVHDPKFQNGVWSQHPVGGANEGNIQFAPQVPPIAPSWRLAQWSSLESIYGVTPTTLPSGSKKWENAYKFLVMGEETASDGHITLHVNGNNEYGGVFRGASDPWPHLLLGHDSLVPNSPWLDKVIEVPFNVDLKLVSATHNYGVDIEGNPYNSGRHAAIFPFYLRIMNKNPSHPDFNNYLYFGILAYDDRKPLPGPSIKLGDTGGGKLIYNIGISPFTNQGLQVGQWKNIKGDLYPHILAALNFAWTNTIPGSNPPRTWLTSTDLADYKVGSMNVGWEVFGLSDVTMQMKNFELGAFGYNAPKGYEFHVNGDRQGWTTKHLTDVNNGPQGNVWVCEASDPGDPQFIGPTNFHLDASAYKKVVVKAMNAASTAKSLRVYWKQNGEASFSQGKSRQVTIPGGGGWNELSVDMTGDPDWTGDITQIRVDVVDFGSNAPFGMDYVRFAP